MEKILRGSLVAWLAATLVWHTGCATHERRTQFTSERDAVVTVESIDVPNRLVTVRWASGETTPFYVDESIREFPQAKVGDQVRMQYEESFAVRMAKPGEANPELQVQAATTKPQAGSTRRGSTRTETKAIVTIEQVDRKANTVTFTGPRGRRKIQVTDPAMQEFVKKLRPGDAVEVTFVEALALSLEPANR